DWNEEVMKWLAVGICLAMVGLAVIPSIAQVNLAIYLKNHATNPYVRDAAEMLTYWGSAQTGAYLSLMLTAAAGGVAIPVVGWVGFAATVAGTC
ncbi:MAG: hypothetical protein ABWW66_02290, partial [Archaeoglobaceae archaeon]